MKKKRDTLTKLNYFCSRNQFFSIMKYRLLVTLAFIHIFSFALSAQNKLKVDTLSGVLKQRLVLKLVEQNKVQKIDTVSVLYERHIGVLDYLNSPAAPQRYLPVNSDYYRMFVPFTYYNAPVERFSTIHHKPMVAPRKRLNTPRIKFDEYRWKSKERANESVDRALMSAYIAHPRKIVRFEDDFMSIAYNDDISKEATAKPTVADLYGQESNVVLTEDAQIEIKKPNWWIFGGDFSLDLAQNYISENWYKGGESNVTTLLSFKLFANYNDQEKVQWENLIEGKLGIASMPSDTVHNYLPNTDLLRLYSKLGIQASKRWYYTISTEIKTQFLNGYKANNRQILSSFLAPVYWISSIGMDYKLNKNNFNFSIVLAPLSHSMTYVGNRKVDETRYGVEKGKRVVHSFGSQIKPKFTWKMFDNVTWESDLDCYTSYEYVRADWKNTFNFKVNKYLSTKIYIYARFDDSTKPKSGDSYFQLNESLTFGLDYSF